MPVYSYLLCFSSPCQTDFFSFVLNYNFVSKMKYQNALQVSLCTPRNSEILCFTSELSVTNPGNHVPPWENISGSQLSKFECPATAKLSQELVGQVVKNSSGVRCYVISEKGVTFCDSSTASARAQRCLSPSCRCLWGSLYLVFDRSG